MAVVANVVAVMPAAISVVLAAYQDAPLTNAAPAPQRLAAPALLPRVVRPVLLVGAPRRLAVPALLPHVVRPVLLDAPLVTQLL